MSLIYIVKLQKKDKKSHKVMNSTYFIVFWSLIISCEEQTDIYSRPQDKLNELNNFYSTKKIIIKKNQKRKYSSLPLLW